MPKPITLDEQLASLKSDQKRLLKQMDAVVQPISLYEAMARALKSNMDLRVKMMEKALADGQADLALFGLLPEISASGGIVSRSNLSASSSQSVQTGLQSLVTSTSQNRTRRIYDISFHWNILDLGVSYFQAKQEANRVLVAEENRRKTAQNLMQEVRASFWQAAGTQLVADEIDRVLKNARKALKDSRKIERERLRSPLESLQYQKDLLEIIRQLENLAETLITAKTKLTALLGLPLNTEFSLSLPEQSFTQIPALDLSIEEMEKMALQLRPELREEIYHKRITAEETHKAIVRLLPGVEFNTSYNYDSNTFLLNNNWAELSGLISQNLTELIRAPAQFERLDAEEKLGDARRLAVHMAVITQVHLAFQEYMMAKHQFHLTDKLDRVNQKIAKHIDSAASNSAKSELERIHFTTDALMSKLQRLESYALIQSALGKIFVSLGLDLLPTSVQGHDLKTLTHAIETLDNKWLSGEFPTVQVKSSLKLKAADS